MRFFNVRTTTTTTQNSKMKGQAMSNSYSNGRRRRSWKGMLELPQEDGELNTALATTPESPPQSNDMDRFVRDLAIVKPRIEAVQRENQARRIPGPIERLITALLALAKALAEGRQNENEARRTPSFMMIVTPDGFLVAVRNP